MLFGQGARVPSMKFTLRAMSKKSLGNPGLTYGVLHP